MPTLVSVPDPHAREEGLMTFVDFLGLSHVFDYIIAYAYHMTSATPTYFIWYILAAIELSRTLSQSHVALKSNVGNVTDKHGNVHKLFVPTAR